jgi:hypothetical protein
MTRQPNQCRKPIPRLHWQDWQLKHQRRRLDFGGRYCGALLHSVLQSQALNTAAVHRCEWLGDPVAGTVWEALGFGSVGHLGHPQRQVRVSIRRA